MTRKCYISSGSRNHRVLHFLDLEFDVSSPKKYVLVSPDLRYFAHLGGKNVLHLNRIGLALFDLQKAAACQICNQ